MTKFVLLVAALGALSIGLPASAQHLDVLVQAVDGQLVTGAADYDNNTWLVGQRVFERQLLSNFRTNDPGFTSLQTGHPLLEAGVQGLAPDVDLVFDIIPTTIDGQRANFWFWDGVDPDDDGFQLTDVDFGFGAPGLEWRVFDDNSTTHIADGSDTVVPGALVQNTFNDGGVHQHIIMLVVDNDGDGQTNRPEGIFLTTMVLRAEGFEDSDPFLFVHRTSGLTNEPRDIAALWANENYESLIGEALPGDFDGSGDVDGADFLAWQRDLGTADDLAIWQNSYAGSALATQVAITAVPEPTTVGMTILAALVCLAGRRTR